MAELRIHRASRFWDKGALFEIFVDDSIAGEVANGESTLLALPEGAHRVRIRSSYMWSDEYSVNVGGRTVVEFWADTRIAGPALLLFPILAFLKGMLVLRPLTAGGTRSRRERGIYWHVLLPSKRILLLNVILAIAMLTIALFVIATSQR